MPKLTKAQAQDLNPHLELSCNGEITQEHDVLSEPTFCEYYKVGLITIF